MKRQRVARSRSGPLRIFLSTEAVSTEIYTLSLHDALPISSKSVKSTAQACPVRSRERAKSTRAPSRSEEHTSELQSHVNLVCRLLLEKKNLEHGIRRVHLAGQDEHGEGRPAEVQEKHDQAA